MKDIEFKAISFILTGYSGYTLVDFFSGGTAGILENLIGAIVGLLVSYFWHKKAIEPLAEAGNRLGVFLFSLPFVISWILITPVAYAKYIFLYEDRSYPQKIKLLDKLEADQKNSALMELKLKEVEGKIKINTSKLDNLITNKETIIKQYMEEVSAQRTIWKKSKHKAMTQYQSWVDSYRGDIGRGMTAIKNIATMLYYQDVEAEKRKIEIAKQKALQKTGVQNLSIKVQEAKTKERQIQRLKAYKKNVENRAGLSIGVFYLVMTLFGIFMESFITHLTFWITPLKGKKVIKRDELILAFKDPNFFLNLIGIDEVNYRANAVFAVLQCYINGEKLTQKNIEKHTTFNNPKTNRKYKVGKVGLEAKRLLINYNNVLKSDISNIDKHKFIITIKNYVEKKEI